jgi:hypothetical protein
MNDHRIVELDEVTDLRQAADVVVIFQSGVKG